MRTWLAVVLMAHSAVILAGELKVPAELEVPAGERLVLKAHATGSQVYVCKAGADGTLQWSLKGPDARLYDKKGAVIGRHFDGPTWKYQDGSEVTAKASAHADSPDANAVPWLLLSATGHTGSGLLSNVSSIQRINTVGGKPPAASKCVTDKRGHEAKSRYSADYYFYAPAK